MKPEQQVEWGAFPMLDLMAPDEGAVTTTGRQQGAGMIAAWLDRSPQ